MHHKCWLRWLVIIKQNILGKKYLIPNTLKERVENFKSLPRYCPVMPKLGYLQATSDQLEEAGGRQARGCTFVLKAEDDFDQSAHPVIMIWVRVRGTVHRFAHVMLYFVQKRGKVTFAPEPLTKKYYIFFYDKKKVHKSKTCRIDGHSQNRN